MNIRRGMTGAYALTIQQRLQGLGLYLGPLDADFGGGTEAGVKCFQRSAALPPSGVVDRNTWDLLFPEIPPPESPLANAPVGERSLALTGSFETGKQPPECFCGIAGNFDGMGISFGALQWNLGQRTLQPLLAEAIEQHESLCRDIFQEHLDTLRSLGVASLDEQLRFARSIQTPRGEVIEPWCGMLKTLGITAEFRAIQTRKASEIGDQALMLADRFGLKSQRGAALTFDVVTQNGRPSEIVCRDILAAFENLLRLGQDNEVNRMTIIAHRVAASARPQFADDVRMRKLTIASGHGIVHGLPYDLEDVYCLTLDPVS